MDGEIDVHGIPGQDSTFWFTRTVGRVLVAEDNEINQLVARWMLEKLGYAVDIAPDGRNAIEMSARTAYAVVFMDCQMSEIDGYTATAAIRRREGTGRRTPIIAMTAHTMQGDRESCLAAGMDDYIAKPVRFAEVSRVLTRLVTDGEQAGANALEGMSSSKGRTSVNGDPDDSIIDESVVREMLSDAGREAGLLDVFVRASHERVRGLADALAAADGVQAARIAHSLKGSCATFGATRMAAIATRLEGLDGRVLLRKTEAALADLTAALAATEVAFERIAGPQSD